MPTIICRKEVKLPVPRDNVAVITYVRDRLLEQGKKSIGVGGSCALRGGDNCACAVGWLYPDSRYLLRGELFSVVQDELLWTGYSLEILRVLQTIHDHYPVNLWGKLFDYTLTLLKDSAPLNRLVGLLEIKAGELT